MVILCMINQIMRIFRKRWKKLQYKVCLAIIGAMQVTSKERIYNELVLHSLNNRRWCSNLIFLYKIVNGLLPYYLYSYFHFFSEKNYSLISAVSSKLRQISSKNKSFKDAFFLTAQTNRTVLKLT